MRERKKANPAQLLLGKHLRELGVDFVMEHPFHEHRRWRLDFVLTESQIAIEIEGGIFIQGRHSRGAGMQKDMDKYNAATMMGYRVLRFSTTDVLRGRAKAFLAEHLGAK